MASRVEGGPAAASKATSIALGAFHAMSMPSVVLDPFSWCGVLAAVFKSVRLTNNALDFHARMPRGPPCLERGQ